jgi:uncharacterized protein
MIVPSLNQSGLLFVPRNWQRGNLLLMLGVSGILLNHRDQLKIDTGEPVEVSAMNIVVPAGLITDEKALGVWAKAELGLQTDAKPPKGGGKDNGAKSFLGKERAEAEKWQLAYNHVNGRVMVEHVKGSASVSVSQTSQNLLGALKNLHKGTGVGIAWILFMDSIAGALIAMALTGFLLWSRLHGGRLLAGSLLMGSAALGTWAVWPFLV